MGHSSNVFKQAAAVSVFDAFWQIGNHDFPSHHGMESSPIERRCHDKVGHTDVSRDGRLGRKNSCLRMLSIQRVDVRRPESRRIARMRTDPQYFAKLFTDLMNIAKHPPHV